MFLRIQVKLQLHDYTSTYNTALQLWRFLWSILRCDFQGKVCGSWVGEQRNGEYLSTSWTLGKLTERS